MLRTIASAILTSAALLASIGVAGKAYDAGQLDKCNAEAGGPKVTMAGADTTPAAAN